MNDYFSDYAQSIKLPFEKVKDINLGDFRTDDPDWLEYSYILFMVSNPVEVELSTVQIYYASQHLLYLLKQLIEKKFELNETSEELMIIKKSLNAIVAVCTINDVCRITGYFEKTLFNHFLHEYRLIKSRFTENKFLNYQREDFKSVYFQIKNMFFGISFLCSILFLFSLLLISLDIFNYLGIAYTLRLNAVFQVCIISFSFVLSYLVFKMGQFLDKNKFVRSCEQISHNVDLNSF